MKRKRVIILSVMVSITAMGLFFWFRLHPMMRLYIRRESVDMTLRALYRVWPGFERRMQQKFRMTDKVADKELLHERYVDLASRIIPRIWPDMNWSEDEMLDPDGFEIKNLYRVPCYTPYRLPKDVYMTIGINHDVLNIVNMKINEEIKQRRDSGEKPTLMVSEVIKRAHYYLKLMEQEIPPDYAMRVWYGTDGYVIDEPVWWVNWEPCMNGVYFNRIYEQSDNVDGIILRFHEELGLVGYFRTVGIDPPPDSMEIRVQPAEAAEKAARLVSHFFSKDLDPGRWRGIVPISRMAETKLVLYEPNWLLNPLRSVFTGINLPRETRLCWRVAFEQELERDNTIPQDIELPPEVRTIWMFMDAGNGKCVGVEISDF